MQFKPGRMAASSVARETSALLKFKLISYRHLPAELQGFLQLCHAEDGEEHGADLETSRAVSSGGQG